MTIEELKSKEQEISTRIKALPSASGCFPVVDGIIDVEKYHSAKYQILWILKEANYGGDNPSPGDLVHGFYRNLKTDSPEIQKHPTIKRIMLATHRILSDLEPLEAFKSIACINIKKIPGRDKAVDAEIQAAYTKNKSLIIEQINTYNPDIIICGNTLHYFENDLPFRQTDDVCSVGMGQRHYFCTKERLYINAYHPANWQSITEHDYCEKIYNAFSYWEHKYRGKV